MNLYEMKLGDSDALRLNEDHHYIVLRVPGGWLFTHYVFDISGESSCFIPYNEEFKK